MSKCEHCKTVGPCHGEGPLPHLCEWSAAGQHDRVARRNAMPAPGSEPPPPGHGDVIIYTYISSYTGYGQIAEWLGRGLEDNGISVTYISIQKNTEYIGVNPFVAARLRDTVPPPDGSPVLQLAVPHARPLKNVRTVAFTMWESTGLNAESVAALNDAETVVVPCKWNAANFRKAGVTRPVHVVPLGISPSEGYTPRPLPPGSFTFGMAARMAHGGVRKNLNEGMKAFVEAFSNGEPVRLDVKVFPDCLAALNVPDDSRININTTPMTPPMMADWYESIHCLFVPSRGEGWGLHTHQAMAVGRPVIAAQYSGTRDFWTPACGWSLPFTEEPAGEHYAGMGSWCVPTRPGMVAALRAAYASPDAGKSRGEAAARRASQFTWDRTGRELAAYLRRLKFAPPKPSLPPLTRQVVNFASTVIPYAARKVAHAAGAGVSPDAPPELVAARLETCRTRGPNGSKCEQLILPDMRCGGMSGCGCYLEAKVKILRSQCPQNHWPDAARSPAPGFGAAPK